MRRPAHDVLLERDLKHWLQAYHRMRVEQILRNMEKQKPLMELLMGPKRRR